STRRTPCAHAFRMCSPGRTAASWCSPRRALLCAPSRPNSTAISGVVPRATRWPCNGSRLPVGHPQYVAAQLLEGALTAGKDDDLLVARLAMQRIEHFFDAVVVGID